MRWTYEVPERKEFIYNGATAFFYEPQSAQVTVFEHFAQTPLAHAMQFLWGAGDLLQSFDLRLSRGEADCPTLQGGEVALRLQPKESLATVDHVYLVFKRAGLRVVQSRVVDPLGNTTDYLFEQTQFGAVIAPSIFAFRIPEGVDVLRANSAQSPQPAGASGLVQPAAKLPGQTPAALD